MDRVNDVALLTHIACYLIAGALVFRRVAHNSDILRFGQNTLNYNWVLVGSVHGVPQGQVVAFSCHTTTALTVNEAEERLLVDIKTYLRKLAPPQDRYLHNDLHLRDVPPDEPINAHSHLMAMTLGNSETVPILDGQLALGTYQSIMLVDLDGPRQGRTVLIQICGV